MIFQDPERPAFANRLQSSFTEVFGELIPSLLGALVIIFAGYLLAKLLERMVDSALRKVGLNSMLVRGGVMEAVERSGAHINPTRVISNLVFWLVMFAVILVAANALGLESLASVFGELVSYNPSVIAASAGALHGGRALARVGSGGVIPLAVFMALQELGSATEIVTTAFAILFGAIALAIALSFGLGNRELAAEITREWYERYKKERDDALARESEFDDDDTEDEPGSAPPITES